MKIHFAGEPSTFRQMRALFNETSTLRVKWATPVARKFRLSRIALAVQQWKQRHAA